jgi:Sulfotransferase family
MSNSLEGAATTGVASRAQGPRVLYVLSAARCGSTLTDMFMGGHSQAASLGEINFLGKALSLDADCTCGAKLRRCATWGVAFDALQASRGTDLRSDSYGLRLWDALATNQIDHTHQTAALRAAVKWRKGLMDLREHLPWDLKSALRPPALTEGLHNKRHLYQTLAECWGKAVLVDSSKNMREGLELTRMWPGLVKLVLVTRDGRGVYLSRRSTGRSREQAIAGWLNYYERAEPMAAKIVPSSDVLRLRYEDLASDPEGVGRLLCDYVGLRFEPEMLDLGKATRHLVNGNETRFSAQRGIRLDERWRTDLAGEELAYFNQRGGDMNRRLGYL